MDRNEPLALEQLRAELEKTGAPWRMAATTMTALTEEERRIRLGVPPSPGVDIARLEEGREAAASAASAARAEAVGAPASFDLRNVGGANYTTPVRDQGACGSCVAFGVVATMEAVARYGNRAPALGVDLSEAHGFYCYGRAAGARCNTGMWPEQLLEPARTSGITFENYYPYSAADQDCTGLNGDWPNRLAKVRSWAFLGGNAALMKERISTYGAVEACIDVYQDFFSYAGGDYRHVSGNYAGGHCISLIGYDDAAGVWIGKNSWGTGWGDQGFFRMRYGECRVENYVQPGGTGASTVLGVSLRLWLDNQQILGLWSNEYDANVYAYGSIRGWVRLGTAAPATSQAMLLELTAAKAGGQQVGLFESDGTVEQIYAW
jgi:papain like protease